MVPLELCQPQDESRAQLWRKLALLLRQRILFTPAIVSAASICHSLVLSPAGLP